jgi:thioredoxin reductase
VRIEDDRLVRRPAGRRTPGPARRAVRPARLVPNSDLLDRLGCDFDAGWVVKDDVGRTTVPGVWVAGNVANPRAQVITAEGEGSATAIAINSELVSEDVVTANTTQTGLSGA